MNLPQILLTLLSLLPPPGVPTVKAHARTELACLAGGPVLAVPPDGGPRRPKRGPAPTRDRLTGTHLDFRPDGTILRRPTIAGQPVGPEPPPMKVDPNLKRATVSGREPASAPAQPAVVREPSPWPLVLGVAAVVGGVFVAWGWRRGR
jgi:hypothetical protein